MNRLAAAALLSATACVHPAVRDLAALPVPPAGARPRACTLRVATPADARAWDAKDPGDRTTGPFVPLIFAYYSASAGPVYARAANLGGEKLLGALGEGLTRALESGGPCAVTRAEDAAFVLTAEVLALHGVSYEKTSYLGLPTQATQKHYAFFPAGQATIAFTLASPKGDPLARFVLSEGHMFDPDLPGANTGTAALAFAGAEDNRTHEVMVVLEKLYARLPAEVERALVANGALPPARLPAPATFYVERMLEDYEQVERAAIDASTGVVARAAIERRKTPILSRPGEWVLSPFQDHLLDAAAYRRLVDRLSARFDVRFEDNLSAATFHGLR